MKRRRRFVAWVGIVGIVFAQLAVTAHACMIRVQAADAVVVAPTLPHHGHCGGEQAAAPLAPQPNACELQCSEVAPTAAAPDLPPVDVASVPITVAPAALQPATRTLGHSFLAANSAAPPLLLQLCRLLN